MSTVSLDFGVVIPFVHQLGMTLERFEGGEATMHFAPRPEHCNSFGVAHGGAVMTFLDVTMANAARSANADSGVITIEMKTSFMAPAKREGGPLLATGKVLQRTGTMAFTEGRVLDAKGRLCAHATGTFKYVRRLAAGRAVQVLNEDPADPAAPAAPAAQGGAGTAGGAQTDGPSLGPFPPTEGHRLGRMRGSFAMQKISETQSFFATYRLI